MKAHQFINAVVQAAFYDAERGVAEYAPENTGERLMYRLNLRQYRPQPRIGDAKYARSIYTAAYWLYETEAAADTKVEG